MSCIRTVVSGLALFFSLYGLYAESPGLSELAAASLANDPASLASRENLRAAESDADAERRSRVVSGDITASGGYAPVTDAASSSGGIFSGSVSAAHAGPAGSKLTAGATWAGSVDGQKADSATFKADWRAPVLVNGKILDSRLSSAETALSIDVPLETARETAAQGERKTVDAVFRLALDAAAAERAWKLAVFQTDISARDFAIAEVKRTQGSISYADLSDAEKTANDARISALEAKFAREKALRALSAATGIPEASLDTSILLAPACALDADFLARSAVPADLLAARRDRQVAELKSILAGAEGAPRLDLSATATVPGPFSLAGGKPADSSWSASAAVSVPLPTGQSSTKQKAAEFRLSAARFAESAETRKVSDESASLRDAWDAALVREELCAALVEQARARFAELQVAAETSTATKLDVDRARLALDRATSALETAHSTRFKAALDIYAYRGLDPRTLLKEKADEN
jgi:outer membrane protein TolC